MTLHFFAWFFKRRLLSYNEKQADAAPASIKEAHISVLIWLLCQLKLCYLQKWDAFQWQRSWHVFFFWSSSSLRALWRHFQSAFRSFSLVFTTYDERCRNAWLGDLCGRMVCCFDREPVRSQSWAVFSHVHTCMHACTVKTLRSHWRSMVSWQQFDTTVCMLILMGRAHMI